MLINVCSFSKSPNPVKDKNESTLSLETVLDSNTVENAKKFWQSIKLLLPNKMLEMIAIQSYSHMQIFNKQ